MKQSFTLMEILITITIFSFIVLTLYKVIDTTKIDIDSVSLSVEKTIQNNYQKTILLEDFTESKKINIDTKNQNSVVHLKSYNTYHNPLYINISYLLHKGNLYRVESLNPISKKTINEINTNDIFIDIIYKNIKNFYSEKGNENYLIYLKTKGSKKIIISIPFTLLNKR